MIRLFPCVEAQFTGTADWPTLSVDSTAFIRLSATMSGEAVGSVMATFAGYNCDVSEPATHVSHDRLAEALEAAEPLLPGGILTVDSVSGDQVTPGCCAGLEQWRAWVDFLEIGESPWLGHDPTAALIQRDGDIEICVIDGRPARLIQLRLSRAEYVAQLVEVERDLNGFTAAVRTWADETVPDLSSVLVSRVTEAFGGAPRIE